MHLTELQSNYMYGKRINVFLNIYQSLEPHVWQMLLLTAVVIAWLVQVSIMLGAVCYSEIVCD